MSTTYWAVKQYTNRGWWWFNFMNERFTGSLRNERCLATESLAREVMVNHHGCKLIKITRFDKAESRARAEARGEVRALEHLGPYATGETAKLTRVELQRLLADARKRAGGREGR